MDKWADKAAKVTAKGRIRKVNHVMMQSGDVLWCHTCGAYGEQRCRLLGQSCQGDPSKERWRNGMVNQLKWLKQGLHPKSKLPMGPTVYLGAGDRDDGATGSNE